jgi:hypothetical protein
MATRGRGSPVGHAVEVVPLERRHRVLRDAVGEVDVDGPLRDPLDLAERRIAASE